MGKAGVTWGRAVFLILMMLLKFNLSYFLVRASNSGQLIGEFLSITDGRELTG